MKTPVSVASMWAAHARKWVAPLAVGLLAVASPMMATGASAAAAKVAKPPRANGHPDFTGVWNVFNAVTVSGRTAMSDPPMSKQGEATVNAFRSQYNLVGMEPNAYCVEPGMPTVMYGVGGQPMEIVQTPSRITLVSEVGMQLRRIFLDGRKPPEGYPTTRNGFSTAHWDGDTLVVETSLIDEWMMPRWAHTDKSRTVERFAFIRAADVKVPLGRNYIPGSLGDFVLVDQLTMYDPDIYETPPSVTVYYRHLRDDEFMEQNCPEGLWLDAMKKLKKQ
ncbi:MAG: hypothetical protein ABIO37_09430 [Caulobacteraceae bacterium]